MTQDGLSLVTAFLAGIASIVSPCVLGLFPVYISVLSGSALDTKRRFPTVVNALGFVAGFSAVFIALGSGAGALGSRLPSPQIMRRFAGAVLMFMGAVTSGLVNPGFLARERRLLETRSPGGRSLGVWGSVMLGVAFSAGWSPCVGPVLASILSIAGVLGNAAWGAVLLGAYSLGLGLPFLAAAIALDRMKRLMPALLRMSQTLRVFAGILMVTAGILYLTGIL